MNAEDYLKQKLNEGYHVPEEIHPFRNGLVNLESLNSTKSVIEGLVNTGEACIIKSDDKAFQNEIAILLSSQIIRGKNEFDVFWQVPNKGPKKCLILTDDLNTSVLFTAMLQRDLKDFQAAEADSFFTQKNDWSALLNDQRSSVCMIILKTKSLSQEHLKVLEKMILLNKRKTITTILIDYKPKWTSPVFDTEVTVHSKEDERFIAITNLHTNIIEPSFSLSKNQNPYSTRALTQTEQKEVFDREKKQAKPSINPNLSEEDL